MISSYEVLGFLLYKLSLIGSVDKAMAAITLSIKLILI